MLGDHLLPAGTKITCPLCKMEFGEIVKGLSKGAQIKASNFRFKKGYEFLNGELMMTKCCGHFWFNGRSLQTERGWVPELQRSE